MANEGDLYIGKVLGGRWLILSELAHGAFGMVFAARDQSAGGDVAVKILRLATGADGRLEFADEARFLERLLPCDRVIDFLGHGTEIQFVTGQTPGGDISLPLEFPYTVVELADGCLTDLILLDHTAFSWRERLEVFRDAAKGVHQMHRRNVVNRDMKSENVLVFSSSSSRIRAKIADLGRARVLTEPPRFETEAYTTGRGDLRFAPPELVWALGEGGGAASRAVDLYHLGSLLFELSTGVGVTSFVLPEARSIMARMRSESARERVSAYELAVGELVDRYVHAADLVASAAPAAIRSGVRALFSQLTHPSPLARFARVQGVPSTEADLSWLLRRIDVLALTLRKAERQARRESARKEVVA